MSPSDFSLILVGAGNMGGAMLSGWLDNGFSAGNISVLDPSPAPAVKKIITEQSINHQTSAQSLAPPDVLIVAVKPQVMAGALDSIKNLIGKDTLVISIAAGKTLSFMQQSLGEAALIRAMPNTPCLVRRGITVACANDNVSRLQVQRANELFAAVGSVEWVDDEGMMDAVTAVSGSGPAYVFHLVEAMSAAGIDAGLPDQLARTLAIKTVAGAGELMIQSELSPETLRQNVTSPGGTTEAALSVLMAKEGFGQLLRRAIKAAAKRSLELS